MTHDNPFLPFVKEVQSTVENARALAVSGKQAVIPSDSKVLLFSPHPDDECIIGLLPLRLQKECGKEIINIPVTFGSNPERQSGRAKELEDACAYLGWGCYHPRDDLQSLDEDDVVAVLQKFKPDVIFFPHREDWNSRHISTHHLLVAALKKISSFACTVVETEFWGAMDAPNLMVEASAEHVATLAAATSLHVGEVARNPYHLRLPAWMQDNVRRGGELVGGQGGMAPDFAFATLYRIRKWQNGDFQDTLGSGLNVSAEDRSKLNELFA